MPLPPSLALSLFYLTSFAVLGAYLPYFNVYLEAIGLTGPEIGIVSALLPLCGVFVPAAGGAVADRLGRRRWIVVLFTFLALLAFALILGAHGFPEIALVVSAYAILRSPALPIVEASAIEISEAGGPHYGRMRAWGSAAFIVVSLGAGPLVGRHGAEVILPIILALLGLNALAALLLPEDPARGAARRSGPGVRSLLRDPGTLLFLLACLLSQASHGPYYVFYSIHLQRAGYGPSAIGLLWAMAVGFEILGMLRMPSVLARFATLPVLAGCLLLTSVRWWVCAWSVASLPMAAAQALHAVTFAAFHVAAVTHTHRLFGEDRRASGQAIYSSVTYGLGNVFGMLLSGLLFDRLGASRLFIAAAFTALLGGFLVIAAARRRSGGSDRGL